MHTLKHCRVVRCSWGREQEGKIKFLAPTVSMAMKGWAGVGKGRWGVA